MTACCRYEIQRSQLSPIYYLLLLVFALRALHFTEVNQTLYIINLVVL